jgi:hypothetical protein
MKHLAYIIASTHSVAVLYIYWNYEWNVADDPSVNKGQVSVKIKDKTKSHT